MLYRRIDMNVQTAEGRYKWDRGDPWFLHLVGDATCDPHATNAGLYFAKFLKYFYFILFRDKNIKKM